MSELARRMEAASPDIVPRLEAGEAPAALARSLGLEPGDLVAALAWAGLADEGPPLIQALPTRPWLARVLTDAAWKTLFPDAARPARLALAAGLLQVLDFWEAGHTAAQLADDLGEKSSAAYWHLIAHRREPDPGNAHYWARRVGRDPIHLPLALAAKTLLGPEADRVAPGGVWSPPALIDLAAQARPGTADASLARSLQRLEMIHLLEASLKAVEG